MRRIINDGHKVDKGSVRLEEYINYFSYDYARPENGDVLAVGGKLFDCPWNVEHKLMTVEIAAEETEFSDTRNNVVFLIDTSGSMYGDDRLGLIQQAFTMLTETLNADDTVSIVTYAGDSRVALDGEKGANKTRLDQRRGRHTKGVRARRKVLRRRSQQPRNHRHRRRFQRGREQQERA